MGSLALLLSGMAGGIGRTLILSASARKTVEKLIAVWYDGNH
jgi:hypothetical protein